MFKYIIKENNLLTQAILIYPSQNHIQMSLPFTHLIHTHAHIMLIYTYYAYPCHANLTISYISTHKSVSFIYLRLINTKFLSHKDNIVKQI